MSPRLNGALAMARMGLAVFPLLAKSKKPPAGGGVSLKTTDAAIINAWFKAQPDANYGVAAGNGLLILDVDPKNDGTATLVELERRHGALPDTFAVCTPSGGAHYYFNGPNVSQRPVGRGLDIRTLGGYVVGPGCDTGARPYQIECPAEIADAPAWLIDLCGRPMERSALAAVPLVELDQPDAIKRGVEYLQAHKAVPSGERDDAIFKAAAQCKDFGLSEDTTTALLIEHLQPKLAGDVPDEDIEETARNAYRYGKRPIGANSPAAEFEPVEAPAEAADGPGDAAPPVPRFRPFRFSPTLGPRPWLIPNLILRRSLTGFVAEPGAGKSTWTLSLAVAIATGRLDILGLGESAEPAPAVIIQNEDEADEVDRRVRAIVDKHKLDRSKIEANLHVHGDGLFRAMTRNGKALAETKALVELRDYVRDVKSRLFVVDPFVEVHEGNENDNAEVAAVMSRFRFVAQTCDAAGVIVHHVRKSSGGEGAAMMSARGAGAFGGNVRAMLHLVRMTREEGLAYGMREDELYKYSRLEISKASYIKPGQAARWYLTEGRDIDSGDNAPAMSWVAMHEHAASTRKELHKLFVLALGGQSEADWTLDQAAQIVAAGSELWRAEDLANVAEMLKTVFAAPYDDAGVTVVAVNNKGARPAWKFRAEREPAARPEVTAH